MSVLSLGSEDKRKENRKESLESVYSSSSRLTLLNKRKRMNPLTGDMSNHTLSGKGDRYVTQRVLSAKTHRVKQLQNQLADAHYHLQELSNENRVLRAMQKKQEIALQRYENSNAELPQVLSSHSEELRAQQSRLKQLKGQVKELQLKMKERDAQLQALRDEHHHLLELSRDKNLLEREKLQSQVSELTLKVQQQAETISSLQRRVALEAKNHRHQLQAEVMRHRDTRHDLDLAISNADKLTTIIEMKEKLISNAATRVVRSPTKSSSTGNMRPRSKTGKDAGDRGPDRGLDRSHDRGHDRRQDRNGDNSALGKLCQDSRHVSSSLSHEDEYTTSTSTEPTSRSKYATSNRTNSSRTTPAPRKSSKSSDDMIDMAKTVQEGMADLTLFDEDLHLHDSNDEMQRRMEAMKEELINKMRNGDEIPIRRSSAIRKRSTDESIEEYVNEDYGEGEKPKLKGRRNSSVSFYTDSCEETTTIAVYDHTAHQLEEIKSKRENSTTEKRMSAKSVDKYTKDIIHDIERSSKVIDKHVKQFNATQFNGDKLVKELQAVDKLSEFVNAQGEIPSDTLSELNNNFKMLTDQVLTDMPSGRKRSISGRRSSRESRSNLLGDANMSNQDLLEDLLGRK